MHHKDNNASTCELFFKTVVSLDFFTLLLLLFELLRELFFKALVSSDFFRLLLLLFVSLEFCYYWFHRASHRIRWFWCAHVVHHGSEFMNFTAAMRQSWLYTFAGNWLFYVPMVWIGFEPKAVLLALSINLGYQFFVHTQWVGKLHPLIELIFNTPSHHRAHHGRNPRYIDKNYGGTLIVFDRLFGTFVEETEAVDYGLVRQVHTHNPLWLTLHEWVAMVRDILRPGPIGLRLRHLWGPPEWEREAHPAAPTTDNPAHASKRAPRPHDHPHPARLERRLPVGSGRLAALRSAPSLPHTRRHSR